MDEPQVQLQPTLAERIFETLRRPHSETVKRDGKTCNAHSRHTASADAADTPSNLGCGPSRSHPIQAFLGAMLDDRFRHEEPFPTQAMRGPLWVASHSRLSAYSLSRLRPRQDWPAPPPLSPDQRADHKAVEGHH